MEEIDFGHWAERIIILTSQGNGLLSALSILKQASRHESVHSFNLSPTFTTNGGTPDMPFLYNGLQTPLSPRLPIQEIPCFGNNTLLAVAKSLTKRMPEIGDATKVKFYFILDFELPYFRCKSQFYTSRIRTVLWIDGCCSRVLWECACSIADGLSFDRNECNVWLVMCSLRRLIHCQFSLWNSWRRIWVWFMCWLVLGRCESILLLDTLKHMKLSIELLNHVY